MTINYPPLNEKDFLRKYLEFSNILLPEEQRLVPSEMELVIEFSLLPEKFRYQRFGSLAKDKVIESLKEKGKNLTKLNINNKLYALLDKKFLRRDVDKVIYLPEHVLKALESFRSNKKFTAQVIIPYEEDSTITEGS